MHLRREIRARALDDEARVARVADQAQRVAGHAEAELELGAHRDPLHEWRQCLGQKCIALVAAVVADGRAQQARGDAEAELFFGHGVE